jgi:NADH dehydrogenase
VLSGFPEDLSASALKQLQELGVEVMTSSRAENLTAEGLEVKGKFIPSRVKIWAAGTRRPRLERVSAHQSIALVA